MRRKWSNNELVELTARYPDEGALALAADLNRSDNAVASRARLLRLRSGRRHERQAWNRATASPTVNARFFDEENAATAWMLGVLWGCGRIKTKHRFVLKITLPVARRSLLERVRAVLSSRHQVQTATDKRIVEIGNSRLVATLIERHGCLPSVIRPDPPVPRISQDHFAAFSLGLNEACGDRFRELIHWSTTLKVADAIAEMIVRQTHVEPPRIWTRGARRSILWSRRDDLVEIHRWLNEAARTVNVTS